MFRRFLMSVLACSLMFSASAAPTYTVYEVEITAGGNDAAAVQEVAFTFLKPGAAVVGPSADDINIVRKSDSKDDVSARYDVRLRSASKVVLASADQALGESGERETDCFRIVVRDQEQPKVLITTRNADGEVSSVILRSTDEPADNALGCTLRLTRVVDESEIGQFD